MSTLNSIRKSKIVVAFLSLPFIVRFLVCLLAVLLAAFVGAMFSECAEELIGEFLGLPKKNEILKFLGIGMGGVLLAIQAVMSYMRAKAMEGAAKAQAGATKQQAKANENAEKGLRQERLKNAIEHLGHGSDSVRLGGAYELFHLAEETKELRQTAFDMLCVHIRRTTGEAEYRENHESKPSEEIQSLLTLLFVQEHEVFKGLHINLQGSWLNGVVLSGARLRKANLVRAHLQEAELRGAHLEEAHLFDAQLQGADLEDVHLQRANLMRAQMQGADLVDAQLQGANLMGAQLQGADLVGALLQGADLGDAKLQGANLMGAQLQGANLMGAQLQGAYLGGAQLQGAYLGDAKLQGANLVDAQLQGAYLEDAHLQRANLMGALLQGAYLGDAQLQGADLRGAQLQGVASNKPEPYIGFIKRIRGAISRQCNLSGVIFEGGLNQEEVNSLVEGLPVENAKELREKLAPHIGQPKNNELPENGGAHYRSLHQRRGRGMDRRV